VSPSVIREHPRERGESAILLVNHVHLGLTDKTTRVESSAMKNQDVIGVGLVGLGRAGWGMQCKELDARRDKFTIVAGCDTYAPWRERFAERYPTASITAEVDALLANPDVDVVSIATPSNLHFEHAMKALAAAKVVFLEKPMCGTYAQACSLREASQQGPGQLFVRHNRRFESGFEDVRRILDSGILGHIVEIKLSRVSFGRRNDWQTLRRCGGGQLGNWGSHIIDHALQFLGAPEKPLASQYSRLARIAAVGDAEDHAKIVLTGQSGTIVDIEVGGGAALPAPTYLVWGRRGALELWDNKMKLKYLDPDVPLAPRAAFEGVPGSEFTLPDGEQSLATRTIGSNFGQPETLQWVEEERSVTDASPGVIWDALHDSICNGTAFPVTLDQAVEVMRVIDEARRNSGFEYIA
jgi:scyllo-inositol 2-dehydrogenase (NADP+)